MRILGVSGSLRAGSLNRELLRLTEGAAAVRDPVVEHRRDERGVVDVQGVAQRPREGLQLGGEHHALPAAHQEQRLDAQLVAGQHQLRAAQVGAGAKEGAAELLKAHVAEHSIEHFRKPLALDHRVPGNAPVV